ncbi:peptidase C15 [Trichothermofontia sichuanensis B231]|uniref:peptidase C15 n=1 Tax=Trichothermofontia sichuanensis TaxID=3045816 RepID=UPI002248703B|nr:peptidase C15 [Trichothermofontia sichuanensis]UZQ55098.1 peptidase C15 [Trichothermofontia sichuanensis B231]
MANSILLTSFTTWKPEQTSNAADDLLAILVQRGLLSDTYHLLRQIPVDFELAPAQVIAKIQAVQPKMVVCCGMAEDREQLHIETQAISENGILHTTIDCTALIADLQLTVLSQDAGRFVCNHLYYQVLHYLRTFPSPLPPVSAPQTIAPDQAVQSTQGTNFPVPGTRHCIFVHVPVLIPNNQDQIVSDFLTILHRLQSLVTC